MPTPLVECIPNFSEGRDPASIQALVDAIQSAGACVLDRTSDHDHHRSVITFVAPASTIGEAAFRAIGEAMHLIDLRNHSGVHPRIGAADVVPFVPLRGCTLEDCAQIAHETGRRVWEELQIPVYFYEAAALRPECCNLAVVRRGHAGAPDLGGPELHPSAGAVVIGARKFLIAFNVNLQTPDVAIARQIAKTVRFSSGGLPHVKAMGVWLASRGQAQVSMNLTDFEETPIQQAFAAVSAEAEKHQVGIAGTELIGLVPKRALDPSAPWYQQLEALSSSVIIEDRLANCAGWK